MMRNITIIMALVSILSVNHAVSGIEILLANHTVIQCLGEGDLIPHPTDNTKEICYCDPEGKQFPSNLPFSVRN